MTSPGFAIVGCGLIGTKRAVQLPAGAVKAVFDVKVQAAEALAATLAGAEVAKSYEEVLVNRGVEVVVISTVHSALAPLTKQAMLAGRHVLVEKPAGLSLAEVRDLRRVEQQTGVKVRVGFNHRYHPALLEAQRLLRSGALGELMFVRGRYGHGGRVGYDKEWRADVARSGGGVLIDLGVHLVDLAGVFLGPFTRVEGHVTTSFWDMPVEDNAFVSLETARGQTAWLHVSCTEWKNLFSLEIYGRRAKLHLEGLGGSYGVERLACYTMRPEMGPPETVISEYPRGDDSWRLEMEAFVRDLAEGRTPEPGLREAEAAMQVVDTLYRRAASRD